VIHPSRSRVEAAMIPTKTEVVIVGRANQKTATIHAVRVWKTVDRDGVRWTESPMKSICEATLTILDNSRLADDVILYGTGGNICPRCREALRYGREARLAHAEEMARGKHSED